MNNNFRRMFCVLVAAVLATFTLPAGADSPQKIFSLQLQLLSVTFDPPFTLKATITNRSPTGNSTINSFTLSVTGLLIVDVAQPASGSATKVDDHTIAVTNTAPIKPGDSFDVTLRVASCGDGVWSAVTWTGSNLSGQNFAPVGDPAPGTPVACGFLACGDGVTVATYNSTDPRLFVNGIRGHWDKDGDFCTNLNYYVTNTLPINNKVHFRWPVSGAQSDSAAVFKYTITGSAAPSPNVSWKNDVNGNPIFVSACTTSPQAGCVVPVCLTQDAPFPYGNLSGDISSTATQILVDTSHGAGFVAQPPPLPIVIGAERMNVTAINGNAWTVVRHVGGTAASPHLNGDPVMQTPLPLLASTSGPYNAGDQAQMCVLSVSGHSVTFFDIGDGWSSP